MKNTRIETKCVQGGYTPGNGEPRQVPIIQSTTFKYETSAEENEDHRKYDNYLAVQGKISENFSVLRHTLFHYPDHVPPHYITKTAEYNES